MATELCEWQLRDPENGLVMCWFVHPALSWIKSQDWRDKNILMFGAGLGDAWLGSRCKNLVVIERKSEWMVKAQEDVRNNALNNVIYVMRECNDCDGKADYYLEIPTWFEPDIIINDDAYRTECCQMAVDYFKTKGKEGILISDNWFQSYVWMSPKAGEIMLPYESLIFVQHDHTNNDGENKWKTAVHFIK